MTRHHLSLWLLLAAAFACFAALSAGDMPTVCGHTLKSSDIVPTLFSARSTDNAISTGGQTACPAADSTIEEVQFPVPVDTAAQTILFIGDSMLEGLGPRLAAYASHNGHTLYNVVWYSSTSEVWGRSDKLQSYIRRLHPTYVIVCLGANELFVPRIAERRREYVAKIIADIDTLPYLWIGPPNWKPDTGINGLVASCAAEGSFFLSDGMQFQRSSDGAHPTRSSAAQWMDSVIRWMPAHSNHPIRMEMPAETSARPARVFVHQPDER